MEEKAREEEGERERERESKNECKGLLPLDIERETESFVRESERFCHAIVLLFLLVIAFRYPIA